VSILEEIRQHYRHILEQHITTLMNILHDFMREKNRIVSDFAKSSYRCGYLKNPKEKLY